MKHIKLACACCIFFASMIYFTSCKKDEAEPVKTGKLSISIKLDSSTISENFRKMSVQTDSFKIIVYNSAGMKVLTSDNLSDLSGGIELDTGEYYVTAESDGLPSVSFSDPYYFGTSDKFSIKASNTTPVEVTCKISSFLVTINYSDYVKQHCADWKSWVFNDSDTLVFNKDENKPGYFKTGNVTVHSELYYTNSRNSTDTIKVDKNINNPAEKTDYVVTVDPHDALRDVILSDGLVLYYPFNNNSADESDNGNNGTPVDILYKQDRQGNNNSAAYFNGTTSYINCGNSPEIGRYSSSFTLCFWIDPVQYSDGTIAAIVSNRNRLPDNSTVGSLIDIPGMTYTGTGPDPVLTGKLRYLIKGGNDVEFARTTSNIPISEWTFITIVYQFNGNNQNQVAIYVNGEKQTEQTMSDTPDPGSTPTYLGFEPFNVSSSYHFTGYMDEVRIYNRVLTNENINELYNLQ